MLSDANSPSSGSLYQHTFWQEQRAILTPEKALPHADIHSDKLHSPSLLRHACPAAFSQPTTRNLLPTRKAEFHHGKLIKSRPNTKALLMRSHGATLLNLLSFENQRESKIWKSNKICNARKHWRPESRSPLVVTGMCDEPFAARRLGRRHISDTFVNCAHTKWNNSV